MNYKKKVCLLLIFINVQIVTASLAKISHKIIDVPMLVKLLTSRGYKIISTEKEKFEAKKEYPAEKFIKNDIEFVTQKTDICKISKLQRDYFFVEVSEIGSLKVLVNDQQIFDLEQDDEDEESYNLLEECCDCNKQTAYVLTYQRALDCAYAFLRPKK